MNVEAYLDTVMSIWAEKGEKTTCPISGNCMAPMIRHGDILVIEHGKRMLRRGDIIIFKKEEKILAHRLVHIENTPTYNRLYTKGDRSLRLDPPISRDQVQGKIIEVRGTYGRLRLTSRFWIVSSYFLATISYITALDNRLGAPLRFFIRAIRAVRSKFAPRNFSLPQALIRSLCVIYKKLFASKA